MINYLLLTVPTVIKYGNIHEPSLVIEWSFSIKMLILTP